MEIQIANLQYQIMYTSKSKKQRQVWEGKYIALQLFGYKTAEQRKNILIKDNLNKIN